jgi:hypothetical protein
MIHNTTSTSSDPLCAHCGRPVLDPVWGAAGPYHPACVQPEIPQPTTSTYPLFKHIADEHGLTLLESELYEIQRKTPEAQQLEWLWKNCKIVFHPADGSYPIEHNPHAQKDSRALIEAEMVK